MGAAAAESAGVQRTPKAGARAGRPRRVCERSWWPLPLGRTRLQAGAWALAWRIRVRRYDTKRSWQGRDGEHVYVRCVLFDRERRMLQ